MSERKIVALSELYPASEIKLGSELYYVCELGKYLTTHGYQLSLDGVSMHRVLRNSRFCGYLGVAIYNGWVTDVNCNSSDACSLDISAQMPDLSGVVNRMYTEEPVVYSSEDAEKRQDEFYDIVTPKKYQVTFSVRRDDMWVWTKGTSMEVELMHTSSFGGTNYVSQCFVSMIAYVAAVRFVTGSPKQFKLVLDNSFLINEHAISDVILLEERTNALDWFISEYNVDEARLNNLGYEAWLYRGREFGFVQRTYSPKEKVDNFKRLGFEVGDIVGLYERRITQKGNAVKSISDFHFAIIKGIDRGGVSLRVVRSSKTKYGYKREFEALSTEVKAMYDGRYTNFSNFKSASKYYSFNDLGVEYMLDSEQYFIAPLQGDDFIDIEVTNGKENAVVHLNEVDYIYWILKDYNVEFNEDKFLKRYFKKRSPIYWEFMASGTATK